jgi:hypothetical protein
LNFEAFRIEAEERHIELIRREQATTAQLARALDEVQSLKNELEQAKHRPSSPDHIASTRHEFETAVRRDFEVRVRASRRATRVSSLFRLQAKLEAIRMNLRSATEEKMRAVLLQKLKPEACCLTPPPPTLSLLLLTVSTTFCQVKRQLEEQLRDETASQVHQQVQSRVDLAVKDNSERIRNEYHREICERLQKSQHHNGNTSASANMDWFGRCCLDIQAITGQQMEER